jgi:hypothetical protein
MVEEDAPTPYPSTLPNVSYSKLNKALSQGLRRATNSGSFQGQREKTPGSIYDDSSVPIPVRTPATNVTDITYMDVDNRFTPFYEYKPPPKNSSLYDDVYVGSG